MVKFGWPVKTTKCSAPPPERDTYPPLSPYREQRDHASPVAFPSTTIPSASAGPATNATATTTPTTHFLSLPIWRKRQEQQVDPPERLSMFELRTYQDHHREHQIPSPRDKSLPPTPTSSDEDMSGDQARTTDSPIDGRSWLYRPSMQAHPTTAASPPARPSPSNAKVALAQAALAIGLPHGLPQASASSSRTDVNSMASLAVPRPSRNGAPSNVRRAKSFQQLSRKFRRDDNSTLADAQRPRSHGIDFGPDNAFDSDGKDKGNALEDLPPHVTPPRKSLTRRASFWNRKRNDSLKTAVVPRSSEQPHNSFDHLLPSLPSLRPMSPLHFDTNISHSPPSLQIEEPLPPSPPGLDLLNGSRNRPLPPNPSASSPDLTVQTSQKLSVSRRRPSTADPATNRTHTQPNPARPPDHSSPLAVTHSEQLDITKPRRTARPRSQTNPPLFHRLSANLFSFGPSPSLLPPTSGASINHSPGAPPRTSTSKLPPPKPRLNEESPAAYVDRLLGTISKADVASALAFSGETFYTNALRAYITRFEFDGDPLDVALRKLLMDVGLPRETQQIDRVMEAFANRYLVCNRSLFISDDHPYILAFSLIMLHTDAFNKSNKRKMTKADYIKNTQLPGIDPEVLEYYYDNIVFAPFIFVEDPLEANFQRNIDCSASRIPSGFPPQHSYSLPASGSTVTLLGKTNKIDPYYMIAKDLLGPLRVDVEEYISLENRYSYKDDSGVWNEENMHKAFINAGTIEVGGAERRMSTAIFARGFGASNPSLHHPSGFTNSPHQPSALRVAKVGLLHRKEITLDIGKRPKASKWRLWSVVLTSSQLLFFRDHTWATSLQEQMNHRDGRLLVPPVPLLKPDEVLSLKDSVALHDRSHEKRCTFLLKSGDNRPYLLQASVEEDANTWVSCINYAGAFKSTGVSMRAPGISGKDVELMGVAAAASHLRDLHCASSDSRTPRTRPCGRNSDDFIDKLSSTPNAPYAVSRSGRSKIINGREDMDLDVPASPNSVGAHQLKATFHQVKADLAAGRWSSTDVSVARPDGRPRAHSLESAVQPSPTSFPEELEHERLSTRTRDIRSKLADLNSKISSLQLQEESHLRLLRNVSLLTPFQRRTRVRLRMVVLQTSKGVQRTRLELLMRLCHKEVLSNDLTAQEREWHRTKKIALKAATDTLQSRREPSIPRTLPLRVDLQPVANPSENLHHHPESPQPLQSSIAESFHTALDMNWSESEMGEQLDSPITSVRDSTPTSSPRPFSPAQTIDGTTTPEPRPSHERFDTTQEDADEEAEEWNKTRAAKRVSLVRMPSTLNVPVARLGSVTCAGSVWITHSPRSTPES